MTTVPKRIPVVGKRYHLLEYPNWEDDMTLLPVKVRRLYTNEERGTIVEIVYNWPFPIIKQIGLDEFQRRLVLRSQ